MPGKRVQIGEETWNALRVLGQDTMKDFQDLADEAFADLLKKSSHSDAERRLEAERANYAGQ